MRETRRNAISEEGTKTKWQNGTRSVLPFSPHSHAFHFSYSLGLLGPDRDTEDRRDKCNAHSLASDPRGPIGGDSTEGSTGCIVDSVSEIERGMRITRAEQGRRVRGWGRQLCR